MCALKVMIVEDEWLNADLIGMLAEDCGCIVTGVANTIASASVLAEADPADIALVDVQLGTDADGIAFAGTLRDSHNMKIVFMTGAGDHNTLQRIADFRPFDTILKPFTAQQLQDVLDRAAALG